MIIMSQNLPFGDKERDRGREKERDKEREREKVGKRET